jgi:hypothetical protein
MIEEPASVVLIGLYIVDTSLSVVVGLLDGVEMAHDRSGSQGSEGEMSVAGTGRRRHRNVKGCVESEPSCLTRWQGLVAKRGSAFDASIDIEIGVGEGKQSLRSSSTHDSA